MHEPEDLTDEQTEELINDLVELRATLSAMVESGETSSQTVPLDQTAVGRLSRMAAMQVQAMAQANVRSLRQRLRMVDNALRLVEEGEYGECRRCAEPVGYRRLKAKPETPFCVACQGAIEKR